MKTSHLDYIAMTADNTVYAKRGTNNSSSHEAMSVFYMCYVIPSPAKDVSS